MNKNSGFTLILIVLLTVWQCFLPGSCQLLGQTSRVKEEKKPVTQREADKGAGQDLPPRGKSLSLMAGIIRSTIIGREEWKDPLGLQAGVIYPFYTIGRSISFRAEANVSMQGAKWEVVTETGRTSLIYINLPLVIRYQHSSGFYGEAGVQPGLLVSAKDIYEGTSEDYRDHMRTLDLGIPVSAGYEMKNGLGLGIRVIPGLINISNDNLVYDRNNIVALRATYTFRFK